MLNRKKMNKREEQSNVKQTCPWALGVISDVGVNTNNITVTYDILSCRYYVKAGVCVYKLN
jgi:hypothetical protein